MHGDQLGELTLRYQHTPKGTILAKNVFFHFRINLSITFHLKKNDKKKARFLAKLSTKTSFCIYLIII